MTDFGQKSLKIRQKSGGQIYTGLKKELETRDDLSTFYTPGIAEPCREIAKDKSLARSLTFKKNSVAVISDGSAVLGLGNIGAEAALPVMEGKCMLFRQFGQIDAVPIVLASQDTDEIVRTIQNLAPGFGGINLEDIAAPRCFEIEKKLIESLDIPVFHDDQHGTAIVVLAALRNAMKIVGLEKSAIKVVFSGAGAAGIACAKLLKFWGVKNIKMADSRGIIVCDRETLSGEKKEFCTPEPENLESALRSANVFIGVSKPGILSPEMIRQMAPNPIIFALANPVPEILPDVAKKAGAKVVATGRSDFPNQINNVLVFPGLFRGIFDAGGRKITNEMKVAAAMALADSVDDLSAEKVIPGAFDSRVAENIADAVADFAN